MFKDLIKLKKAKTKRFSSWQTNGKNDDWWPIEAGESRIIADIKGPGMITHIWMTQGQHYRDVLIKITWDDEKEPSILCPLGDFFGLGHTIVNSYQSALFTASTNQDNKFESGCALNCYAPMPFKKRAVVELINESKEMHRQYFYIDYEEYEKDKDFKEDWGYFHAEFHRENPFGGWGHEIRVNSAEANIVNTERLAWDNNYVILETKGRGHYIGCNYSVTNLQGTWWGEGDDMIWVDGYKWPPDLHGTGSEDYLNQAWGMQDNAFMRNGSSIYENNTGGYQTSYVHHIENPIRFEKEIKVTIEFGHGNHLRNEVSTVAYWYAEKPTAVKTPPPVEKRQPIRKINGEWVLDEKNQITSKEVPSNDEMKLMKTRLKQKSFPNYLYQKGPLVKDENGVESIKIILSRDNPNLYEIQLSEIVEDLLDKSITLEIYEKSALNNDPKRIEPDVPKLLEIGEPIIKNNGILTSNPECNLIIKDEKDILIKDLLTDAFGKQIEIETLLVEENKIENIKLQIRYDK